MICHINLAKGFRGGERQTELLINSLKNEFKQTLIVREDSKLIERIKDVEIKTIRKPYLLNISKCRECSIIHSHETKASQIALFANIIYKIPYFITRRVPFKPKKNFLNNLLYSRAERVYTLSYAIDKVMRENFKLNTKIVPSAKSNLKTTEKLEELRERFKGKFIIGNIGALVNSHKGQLYIIKSAKKLSYIKSIHFLIVGEGKDRELYQKASKGLNNITFEGFRDNIGDYLALFDIFLFPSLSEGLGSILLDAMDFKKAIIATNVDGITDIIQDGINGILINPKSEEEITSAILKLYKDKNLREKLSAIAKERADIYSIENLVKYYIKDYKAVIK